MFERREEAQPAFAGADSTEISSLIQIDPDFHVPAGDGRGAFQRAFRVLFPKAS